MNHSKLLRALYALTKDEIERFDKFIRSPYFNSHKDTIQLFDVIKPFLKKESPEDLLTKENIYQKIYPNNSFDDLQLRTLKKYLLKKLYQFLEYEAFSKANDSQSYFLLKALAEKELVKNFQFELQRKRRALEKSKEQDSLYFLRKFEVEDVALSFSYTHASRWEQKDILGVVNHLTYHYLAEKLKYACSIINMGNVFDVKQQIPLLEEILSYCEKELAQLPIVIQVFYHLYRLYVQEDGEVHYHKLKSLSIEAYEKLPKDDWHNIYFSLINYCNGQYRSGKEGYLEEMLALYKEMLAKDLLENLSLNLAHHYKNITTLGLRLGEFSWTEEFIYAFKELLPLESRENNFRFNLANLRAYEGKYKDALSLLREVSFIDPFYRMGYEILLMKIYYECNEVEPLLALCDSFRLFVRRKRELSKRQQQAYMNFAKLTKKLIKNKLNFRYKQVDLSAQIEACDPLIERGWLLGKQKLLLEQFIGR